MTPVVQELFDKGKKLYEDGKKELLPLLKAVNNDSINGNSKEFKDLKNAIEVIESGKELKTNKDGFIAGSEISEKDYFKFVAQQRQKK